MLAGIVWRYPLTNPVADHSKLKSIIAAAAKLSANSRQNCVLQAPKVELSKTENLLFTNEYLRNKEHVSFLPISDSVPAADAWPISFLVVLLLANGARAKLAPSLPHFCLVDVLRSHSLPLFF